jgi:hypothetical protein
VSGLVLPWPEPLQHEREGVLPLAAPSGDLGDDDALTPTLASAEKHPAKLVRDAAESLGAKLPGVGFEERFRSLGTVQR